MSSRRDPPRLRTLGAELPDGLAEALESDFGEFPEEAELSQLTSRLAPLLGTATVTAAATIPATLMAPKAPLSFSATLKLLAWKWGHTVILPMALGAASGGVVWEAREYVAAKDRAAPVVANVVQATRTEQPARRAISKRESPAAELDLPPPEESAPAELGLVAPQARPASAIAPVRTMAPPASSALELPAPATVSENVTEIELIDRAQRALAQQPSVARHWVDEHAHRFPEGTFVQERETIAIEALVGEGRLVEARTRALQFRSRFPESTYLRRIEAVLRSAKSQ